MKGQWIGRTTGDLVGQIIVNVDDLGDHFSGVAFTIPDDDKLPSSACFFDTKDKRSDFSFTAMTSPINPVTELPCRWQDVQSFYPGMSHSSSAPIFRDILKKTASPSTQKQILEVLLKVILQGSRFLIVPIYWVRLRLGMSIKIMSPRYPITNISTEGKTNYGNFGRPFTVEDDII